MAPTRFTFTGTGGPEITAYRWDPAGAPTAAVQIAHGMGEHLLRYGRLAEALTAAGYVVYGQDHRGHGASVLPGEEPGELGPDGWVGLVEDISVLAGVVHAEHPGLPLALVAHSMGSFAAQQYLLDHGDEVDAVVLTGTAALDALEPALDFDAELDLSMFNAPFEPRTGFEWLSRDEAEVDAYVADPLCGFGLGGDAVRSMFARARRLGDAQVLAAARTDLPLYVAVGDADPVNAGLALVQLLVERYRAAGVADLVFTTYPGARHEVFNETNRDEVVFDLLAWLRPRLTPA